MAQCPNRVQLRGWVQMRHCAVAILITICFLWVLRSSRRSGSEIERGFTTRIPSPRDQAANSTLGFEKILALSVKPSWRTRGLRAAARLTGLDISIPIQPHNSDELIHAFEHIGAERNAKLPQYGSALAWVSHLDLLKYVISSGFSSSLIVEDDVDWDLNIKYQMKLISENVRAFTNTNEQDNSPYGTGWDVLWIGHCGSAINNNTKKLMFVDNTRCKTELYSGWSKRFIRDYIPEGSRFVQDPGITVCTFGYAVTAKSAAKVLRLLSRGADEAFDVSMSNTCRSGQLKCIVINPQVMNHYEPPKDHGYLSLVHEGDGQGVSAENENFEKSMGTTGNIMKSSRCKALFDNVCMRPPSEI